MQISLRVLASLLAVSLFACGEEPADASGHDGHSHDGHSHDGHSHDGHSHSHGDGDHDHVLLDETVWSHHGHGVHDGDSYPVDDLLADPASFEGKTVRVGGELAAVCPAVGCWIRLGTAESNLLVKVKDLAFHVPKDATGDAVAEGVLTVREISVEEQKRMLEQSGDLDAAAAVSEPIVRPVLTATGIAIAKQK